MRRAFISADLEGCAAVASVTGLLPDRWEWSAARKWMTHEVNAVAEAAFEAGYDEVIVGDGHGNSQNIDPDLILRNVWLVRAWPRPLLQMQGVEMDDVQTCAFVGYHAHSGAPNSILTHVYSGATFRFVHVNGISCSEGYLNAALAGSFGVPVIFVAGDAATIRDSEGYAPDAKTFITKQSFGWRSQMSLSPQQVCENIKAAAFEAFSREHPRPFELRGRLDVNFTMSTVSGAEMLAYLPNIKREDSYTVSASFDHIEKLMKFISFVIFYTPSGNPAL